MPSELIQWFPGHMAKTKRLIRDSLPLIDLVIEVLDARIPASSHNPDIEKLSEHKPRLILLNKASLANQQINNAWRNYYKTANSRCIFTDCITGDGLSEIMPTVREILSEKLDRYATKGMVGRTLKALVVGIPNSGKSTFINKMAGAKKAKAENRPGVTLTKQWVTTPHGLDLLDTPGVLWPKFEDQNIGENLAITGAIRDQILDIERIAWLLCNRLRTIAPKQLCERYKIDQSLLTEELSDYDLMEVIGRKRGFLISGGEVDIERLSNMLIDEFRAGKIGKISLETPPEN